MIASPPQAFVGYEWGRSEGFIVKVCLLCAGASRAIEEAKPLKVKKVICVNHSQSIHYEQLAKRMGES